MSSYYTTTTESYKQPEPAEHNTVDLINKVCEVMGIAQKHMRTKSRESKIKYTRWLIWYFLREQQFTFKEAGQCFKGIVFDHSTVCNAMDKLPHDIERMPDLRRKFNKLKKWHNSIAYVDDTA